MIRPFLEGEVERPFLLAMTAAGQSALNVRGLDTVVIYDARYGNVVERGRNVLHRLYLGANEILQMAGRVHGRVPNGEVVDPERSGARLRAAPAHAARVPARRRRGAGGDHLRRARRGRAGPRPAGAARPHGLPPGGRAAHQPRADRERPAHRATAARSRRCRSSGPGASCWSTPTRELIPMVAVCSNIDSLHRMTREERDLHGAGRQRQRPPHRLQPVCRGGEPARLPGRGLRAAAASLRGWAGGVGRAARRAGQGDRGHRAGPGVGLPLARAAAAASSCPTPPRRSAPRWADLVARVMPFDLVIDEHTADGQEARVSKTSVAGSWGAVAGSLRFFADRFGVARAGDRGHHALLRPGRPVRGAGAGPRSC